MNFTTREINTVRQAIDITLSHDEFAPYLEQLTEKARQKATLKGFRPGKVPKDLVKKLYGENIEQDAVEQAIQNVFSTILKENDAIRPFSQPILTNAEISEDGGVEATIVYDVLPEFELGEYKGIASQRVFHVVSDQEVDFELDRLRERSMAPEAAESVADENHIATIDLHKIIDNVVVFDEPFRDVQVYLRRQEVNPELKENLLNTREGDTFRVSLPTGENAAMTLYQVTVKSVQRAALPEPDDAFAASVMGDPAASIDQLKDAISESILFEYNQRYNRMFRDELIGKIVEAHRFDVPESLVHNVLDSYIEDLKNRSKTKELPRDFNHKQFHDEMHPVAENTARWSLIRDRIAQVENLVAEETDYEGLAQMEAERVGMEYDKVLAALKTFPEVTDRIIAEKTLQLIEDYAIVRDVIDTELLAQQENAKVEQAAQPEEPAKLISL